MADITDKPLVKVASGVKNSGSMMWLGTASSEQVKEVLETGSPTVRIVKPFKAIEAMIKELKEAEEWGAIAVGTDIDFFYGGKRGDRILYPNAMAPKSATELKRLVTATRLPFILKEFSVPRMQGKPFRLVLEASLFQTMVVRLSTMQPTRWKCCQKLSRSLVTRCPFSLTADFDEDPM